jgi:MOSC domain-containing protein YiiM
MAKLNGIAIAPKILAPMEIREEVEISIDAGITGDARGRKRKRQISVLFADDWADACAEIGETHDWIKRRANLYVTGCRSPQEIGKIIRIGSVELEVTEETEPCEMMDAISQGLRQAMTPAWRGGVCCRVKSGGVIRTGDDVFID